MACKQFPYSVGCFFTLLLLFLCSSFLVWCSPTPLFLLLLLCTFGVVSKKPLPRPMSWNFIKQGKKIGNDEGSGAILNMKNREDLSNRVTFKQKSNWIRKQATQMLGNEYLNQREQQAERPSKETRVAAAKEMWFRAVWLEIIERSQGDKITKAFVGNGEDFRLYSGWGGGGSHWVVLSKAVTCSKSSF